jgi:hypothetical protein
MKRERKKSERVRKKVKEGKISSGRKFIYKESQIMVLTRYLFLNESFANYQQKLSMRKKVTD